MPRALPIFQALADPTRLRILALLRAMELSVGEIAQVLGQSQPRVSRHVKILAQVRLIDRRKEGAWVFLTLGPEALVGPVFHAIDSLAADAPPNDAADRARLEAIRADRTRAAEDYFETHAAEWDAIRSLHVSEQAVEAEILQVIGAAPIGRLVDIGTGTGRMMELLGEKAVSAIGFDRSPSMLRVARTKLAAAGLPRVELRQGDMYALPMPEHAADLAIMHQVLHYAQHPAAAIAEAARLLAPDGRLLVVDFASHDHELLRDRDAHQWLGFSDAQIEAWCHAAGLSLNTPRRLEGALTVKLWPAQKTTRKGTFKA